MYSLAAGLGRLNVLSSLGQPFRGEIELISVQPSELESLSVKMAAADAYSAAQLSYPESSLGLRLVLSKRPDNSYIVQVSSAGAVDEPVFNLLVDLSWLGGKVQRQYTALLDPAGYKVSALAAPTGARAGNGDVRTNVSPSANAGPSASNTSKTISPASRPAKPSSAAPSKALKTDQAYSVKRGDTLTGIAKSIAAEGVSLEQVIVGLYQANPEAFNGNMNRLQQGRILNIPKTDEFNEVSKPEAIKEIKVQSAQWQQYRQQLSSAAARMPAADAGSEGRAGGRITAKVEDKGALSAGGENDVLKLSRGNGKAEDQMGRIKALEEEVSARKQALDDASQRVAELQKNIQQMEALAALQSGAGAELQQKASEANAQLDASAPVVAAASEVMAEVASAPEPTPKVAPKPAVQPAPPAEPGIIDTLVDNALPIGGGFAAVLLGVAGLLWSRNRRRPNVFENSLITSGDLKPNTVLGRTGGGVISTQAENSFLTDFSRQGLGTIDTDEVDPIAEADVYMAYGRDAQAEEILKDALLKTPLRHEIRMKLLDIYAARKDKVAFEEIATDLYASVAGKGPLWEQAAYLGRSLDPNNPLYAQNGQAAGVVAAAAVLGTQAMSTEKAPITSEPQADLLAEHGLDFEFEMPEEEPSNPVSAADALQAPSEFTASPDVPEEIDLGFDESAFDDLSVKDTLPDLPAEPILEQDTEDGMIELNLPIDIEADAVTSEDVDLDAVLMPSEDALEEDSQFDASAFELPDFDLDLGLADEEPELPAEQPPVQVVPEIPEEPEKALDDIFSAQEEDLSAVKDSEFDLDFGFDTEIRSPQIPAESLQDEDLPINLELEIGDTAAQDLDFSADDPVQTKIDLARAYIDMGDVEGAREILQEAEQEGSPEQQGLAKSLLAGL